MGYTVEPPDSGYTIEPPTPSNPSADLAEQEGAVLHSPAEAKAAVRGLVKGAASIGTLPADIVGGIYNKVADLYKVPEDHKIRDWGSTFLNKALNTAGLPEQKDVSPWIQGSMEMVGGLLPSLATAGGAAAGDIYAGTGGLDKWSHIAGHTAPVNEDIAGNAIARGMGENGETKLTSDVMGNASKRLKAMLDVFRSPQLTTRLVPQQAEQAIVQAAHDTDAGRDLLGHTLIRDFMEDVNRAGGRMSNAELGNYSTWFRQEAKKAATAESPNYPLAQAFNQLKNGVEDIIGAGFSPGMRQIYDKTKSEYRLMAQLEDSGALNVGSGRVNLPKWGNWLQNTDKSGYLRSPFEQLSDAYKVGMLGQASAGANAAAEGTGAILPTTARMARFLRVYGPGAIQYARQYGVNKAIKAYSNNPALAHDLVQMSREELGDGESQQ